MDRAGHRAVEVELVEDDPDGADARAAARADAPDPGPRRRARLPRGVRWGLVALAVVVVGTTTVTDRLESAAVDARLADVDGLSASLARPPVEAWRAPGDSVLGVVRGTVVAQGAGGRGTVGIDAAGGEVRWTQPDGCQMVAVGGAPALPWTTPLEDRPDDLVLCLESPVAAGPAGAEGAAVPSRTAHVLDPVTGDVLRCLDLGPLSSVTTVGSDLLALGIAPDAHAEAARWSLLTGERRWSYRSPDVVPPHDSWGSTVDAAVVQLDIGPWSLTLDAATGERIGRQRTRAVTPRVLDDTVEVGDGATATSSFDGRGRATTTVRAADGTARAVFPGLLARPTVDDGSAGEVVLVVRSQRRGEPPGIVGVDAATGTTAWRSVAPVGRAAVVQGVALVDGDGGVRAVDATDGEPLWRTPPGAAGSGRGMVTDGRRVLTVETGAQGDALTARDLAAGTVAWTAPVPVADAVLVLLPDGTVVATGSGELVALRP